VKKQLPLGDYFRCPLCRTLVERKNAVEGPRGKLYGPECGKKVIRSQRR
jgi:endogenous inhibitor of DNA gyrase (YacG/DUF329 family)